MMKVTNLLSVSILFMSSLSIAHADIYKCRDADGTVLYTSNPESHSTCQPLDHHSEPIKIVKDRLIHALPEAEVPDSFGHTSEHAISITNNGEILGH